MVAGVLVLASCGDSDGRDAPDAAIGDAPVASLVVQISSAGNDAHDGITLPVETLKRALEIATADARVSDIVLGAGTYSMRGGERFPYNVPPNVVGIAGPVGGGAVLIGTGTETGLIFGSGQLQDVALNNFAVAIEANGVMRLKHLSVKNSGVAVRAGDKAKLRIDHLNITGGLLGGGACSTGIAIDQATDLTVTDLTTRDLGAVVAFVPTVSPRPAMAGTIDIVRANVTSAPGQEHNPNCAAMFSILNHPFALSDSVVDGGYFGVQFLGAAQPLPITITNTIFRNFRIGITGSNGIGQISGGEMTNNELALGLGAGSWTLVGVKISNNEIGISMSGQGTTAPAALAMRRCMIVENRNVGLDLRSNLKADMGTSADPGDNVIAANSFLGLRLGDNAEVDAAGNSWTANVQGADPQGRYATIETLVGPIDQVTGNNFALGSGATLRR